MKLTADFIDHLMEQALAEAEKAAKIGEVPVGAVVAVQNKIISRAHNLVETKKDASAHAEVLAMQQASSTLSNWRLNNAVLCVTLEPCTMCIGALRLSRIGTIIFGAEDPRMGAVGSLYDLSIDDRLGAPPRVIRGIREAQCRTQLSSFFEELRTERSSGRVLH
ncbi:MAG: nucleoside deaminase [Proteobacteria bacterium]|nr:nucleoside deaminase [Pseudomonadota bacterium]